MHIPWRRLAGIVVALLALGFLASVMFSQWSALAGYNWQLAPGWALLSLLGLELAWCLELDTWRLILRNLGGPLSFKRAAQIWYLSAIMRYIPGNVWQFVGMTEMAVRDGVPRTASWSSILIHEGIATAAGIVLAALYFAVAGHSAWAEILRPFLFAVPLGLLLLHPHVLQTILNWMLIRLRQPPLHITLTWGRIWYVLGRDSLLWLLMGFSFTLLVRALIPLDNSMLLYLAASWTAAFVIGYLSMITPSGLGIREGVLLLLLSAVLPGSVAAAIAILARLWMTVGELLGAGFVLLTWRLKPAGRPSLPELGER
jgi:glycosyltransferase 2 family protein